MIHSFLVFNDALWAYREVGEAIACVIILGLLAYTYYLLQKAQRELQVQVTESQRYQTALQETEERLRLVIHNMPVMINAFDGNRNILVWNQECERVTGYT
ncbi:MAG: PAS domain S-box protein, partial [Nostocaceae cyanobacterium]|nr:PAS domain S-box protein [Nostocaceae cyanobacterium]